MLSTSEAAERLAVSQSYISKACKEGLLLCRQAHPRATWEVDENSVLSALDNLLVFRRHMREAWRKKNAPSLPEKVIEYHENPRYEYLTENPDLFSAAVLAILDASVRLEEKLDFLVRELGGESSCSDSGKAT